jgi:DNA repair protein RadC
MDKRAITRTINTIEKKYISAEAPPPFISGNAVANYLRLKFPDHDREHFLVLFLNNQNQLITCEIIFSGNINSVVVYPAVIARKALQHNASEILLAQSGIRLCRARA